MQQPTIGVVGLGYVGLPLATAFGRTEWRTYGYDINEQRIAELHEGKDSTRELTEEELWAARTQYTTDPACLEQCNVLILAIPTPVDDRNRPDLSLLLSATETVGRHLRPGTVVVYESTVYPGVTEEICGPILERTSGLRRGEDFKLGYSPERINPGDREHTLDRIVKVVAGEDPETTDFLAALYGHIIPAGIHRAPSIKVAEMSKAIENAQRDLNIAYLNEIAMMCHRLGLATHDVLEAARTKWNFLPFTPGLVGGHCIGVDPYYLLEKAYDLSMDLPLVTAARRINDGMAIYINQRVLDGLREIGRNPWEAQVLVLGMTFKEDLPDTRNAKSVEVVRSLQQAGCTVDTHDPYVANGRNLFDRPPQDALLLLVPHREYRALSPRDFRKLAKESCLFYDLKSLFERKEIEEMGMQYRAL